LRVGKNEAIYNYLAINHPELIEDEIFRPNETAVISIPQKAPEGAVTRHESALNMLERVKAIYSRWIKPGHIDGQNTHNVSATVSLRPEEWKPVGEWMWENRNFYNGLSVLPYDNGSYKQAPFEDITEQEYELLSSSLSSIDLTRIIEAEDNTDLSGEVACSGVNGCEII
jgi:ribonucleoside-diphosphate reductase alpha chain